MSYTHDRTATLSVPVMKQLLSLIDKKETERERERERLKLAEKMLWPTLLYFSEVVRHFSGFIFRSDKEKLEMNNFEKDQLRMRDLTSDKLSIRD